MKPYDYAKQVAAEVADPLPAPATFRRRPVRADPECTYCGGPFGWNECDGCLCTWGLCTGCDQWAWVERSNGGETQHCGACCCPTCNGGPKALAHPHCAKHGTCRPGFCSDACADAWAADGEARP